MRIAAALVIAGALVGGMLVLLRESPAPEPTPPAPAGPGVESPEVPPPPPDDPPAPPAMDATRFHALDAAERVREIRDAFGEDEPAAAFTRVAGWLDGFEPGRERAELETLVEAILGELAAGRDAAPSPFTAVTAVLRDSDGEPQRLVAARLLLDAYSAGLHPAPSIDLFEDVYERSTHPEVRRVLVEDVGLLHDFDGALRLIEAALLGKQRDTDIDAAVLAIETVIDEQRRLVADLSVGTPLHPELAERFRSPADVPDSRPELLAALEYAALRGPQQRATFEEIIDLLVLLRGKPQLEALAERAQPPALRGLASAAARSIRSRSTD